MSIFSDILQFRGNNFTPLQFTGAGDEDFMMAKLFAGLAGASAFGGGGIGSSLSGGGEFDIAKLLQSLPNLSPSGGGLPPPQSDQHMNALMQQALRLEEEKNRRNNEPVRIT